jgi:excisionase family DNA binding protein
MKDIELEQRLSQIENKIADIKQQLNRIETICKNPAKTVFSMDDAAVYMGISKSYLYRLVSYRKVPFYKSVGGKMTFFKKSDLDDWVLHKRFATTEELEIAAATLSKK